MLVVLGSQIVTFGYMNCAYGTWIATLSHCTFGAKEENMATIASMFNMEFGKYSNCNITNTSKSVGRAEIEIEVEFIVNYAEIAEYEKTLATKYRLETFRITPKYIGNPLNISNPFFKENKSNDVTK